MRLAIVTGGSRGLGLALCEGLSERGYRVLEFSRTAPHPFSVRVDLSLPIESRRLAAAAIAPIHAETLEGLVIVSNASTLEPVGPVSAKSPDTVAANLNVNLVSPIQCLAEIVARFQSAPCSKVLVNISSGAARKGYAGWSLYCAAKAGMEAFFNAVAAEQRDQLHPFVVISIDPGVIDTQMQTYIRAASTSDFPEVERFVRRKEEGGLASPRDVARRVLRIVSSPSLVSGGRYDVEDLGEELSPKSS